MKNSFELKYNAGGRAAGISGEFSRNETSFSDGTVALTLFDEGSEHKVSLRAFSDVTLVSYTESGHDFWSRDDSAETSKDGDVFFLNGYQSWTDTKETYLGEKERDVRKLPRFVLDMFALDRYGDCLFYKYDKNKLHGYDVFYRKGRTNGFVLNANAKTAYLIFEVNKTDGSVSLLSEVSGLTLKAGQNATVCDYFYTPTKETGVKLMNEVIPVKERKKIFGYTSWYNYYQNINENIILRDLDALDHRFNLFQIDDGYQTFVGDWLDVNPEKFPNGLRYIVDRIHAKGLMAGIWLAPLVAEQNSRLYKEHNDWLKKGPDGLPVKCGGNWSGFYALDLENEEARNYIAGCLRHYAHMGFDFFKLDFLYASSLPAYDGKTRAQSADFAYSFIREVLGDRLILGCGASLFSSHEKFDYLRVGPDVSLEFDDKFYMRIMHRERVSTKITLQNTVYRSILNGRLFGNDPDVFLLRDTNISLTESQRKSLITLNALFGSVLMTSDNIAEYDDAKKKTLADALELYRYARVQSYTREGDSIRIVYEMKGETREITYNTKKGVIS